MHVSQGWQGWALFVLWQNILLGMTPHFQWHHMLHCHKTFSEHFGRIFCEWQMCQMWPNITVVWAFHSVQYCLSIFNVFPCIFLHLLPQWIYQHCLKQLPLLHIDQQKGQYHWNPSCHFLAEYSAADITLSDISISGSLCTGQSHILCMSWNIIPEYFKCEQASEEDGQLVQHWNSVICSGSSSCSAAVCAVPAACAVPVPHQCQQPQQCQQIMQHPAAVHRHPHFTTIHLLHNFFARAKTEWNISKDVITIITN